MHKNRLWQMLGLGLMAILVFAGCAGLDDFSAVQKDVAELKAAVGQKAEKAEAATKADLSTKADKAAVEGALRDKADNKAVETLAKQQGETAKLLAETSKNLGDFRKEAATKAEVAKVEGGVNALRQDLQKADATVARVAGSVDERVRSLENRVVGAKQQGAEVGARVGALEDNANVDHNFRLFRLRGFTTASAKLTLAMEKELDAKVVPLLKTKEWRVRISVGFADSRPYIKDGKDQNPGLSAERGKVVAEHLGKAIDQPAPEYRGRGITQKFGGWDFNRSTLIYLERVQANPQSNRLGSRLWWLLFGSGESPPSAPQN